MNRACAIFCTFKELTPILKSNRCNLGVFHLAELEGAVDAVKRKVSAKVPGETKT